MYEQKVCADQLHLVAQKEKRVLKTTSADWDLVAEIKSLWDTNAMLQARYIALLNSHPTPKHALALLPQQYQKDFAEVLDLPTVEYEYSPTNPSRPTPVAETPRWTPPTQGKGPSKPNPAKSPMVDDARTKIDQADLSLVDAVNIVSLPTVAKKGRELLNMMALLINQTPAHVHTWLSKLSYLI